MTENWYVVRTGSRAESQAARELEYEGFHVFFPRVRSPLSLGGYEEIPLFPGYLFLSIEPDSEDWPNFRRSQKVLGWVRFGGEIPCLPSSIIEELRQRIDEINGDGGMWRRYQPGEKVLVVANSMKTNAEVVEGAKSPQARVKVLMQFMGRIVPALVPWSDLRPVENQVETPRPPRRTRGNRRWVAGFKPEPALTV